MDVVAIVVSSMLALVGFYLTHSIRRQQRLRIDEQRLDSYRKLWQLMEVARPSRAEDGTGPLTRDEAHELYRHMVSWYYDGGNGLLLSETTLALYTKVRQRLASYAMGRATHDAWRSMRDLSLLRQQMRLDLKTISGRPSYWENLSTADETLLKSARITSPKRWARPWHKRLVGSIRRQ